MYSGPIDVLIRFGAVLVGVGFLVQAGLVLRQSIAMAAPAADRIRDATGGDTVAIDGTVRATRDDAGGLRTVTAPLSGDDCVFAAWRIEEFFGHEVATQDGWTDHASGYDAEAFELADGSGTIAVDVSGDWEFLETEFDLAGLDSPHRTVSIDEDVPAEIRDFEAAVGAEDRTPAAIDVPTSDAGPKQGDRRYYEATIDAGDDLFVSGVASERDAETGLVVTGGGDDRLLVSDQGRRGATRSRLFGVVVLSVVGLLLCWYGVAPLLRSVPITPT
ncbi:hypothetical protein [Halopenitus persicus]|uniref:Uncharacterized protein n=1 Tax=Halopenitus persicus TaxID=1048396 RepID=A0A1H3E5P9_9EURY|nr:hypothetical protein [Halopenitus persicus]SDX73995.1 hypothetical protein SAMN05216564_101298 [Halopenitus persicus]